MLFQKNVLFICGTIIAYVLLLKRDTKSKIRSLFRATGSVEGRRKRVKRPRSMDVFAVAEMEEPGSVMAMDVDDVDPLDVFGDGLICADNKLADADFFNSFEDDFDDSDIN